MATERQIKANQRNAQLSTGPRTAAGVAKSAQNGRPHGFCSDHALITSPEDRLAYDEMIARYSAQYDNGSAECRDQINHLVHAEFQRRMIARAEVGHFHESILHAIDHLWGKQRLPDDAAVNENLLTRMVGITVMRDLRKDEVFLKMSRYEGEKLRNYNRALGTLKRNLANGSPSSLSEPEPLQIEPAAKQSDTEAADPTANCALSVSAGLTEPPADHAQTVEICPNFPARQPDCNTSALAVYPGKPAQPSPGASDTEAVQTTETASNPPDTPDTTTGPRTRSVSEVVQTVETPSVLGEAQGFSPALTNPTPEKTIQNPISDISQPNQPPTLCKNNPEIDSCVVCRHPEHETLREILTLPHDIQKISAKWNIPILDLWRCRLHHIEDPMDFYSIIGAAARKARLFDATDLNPQVAIPESEYEICQEQSHAA